MDYKNAYRRRSTYRRTTSGRSRQENEKKEMFLFRIYVTVFMVLVVFCITKINNNAMNGVEERLKEALSSQISVEAIKDMSRSIAEEGIDSLDIINGENLGEGTISESSIPEEEFQEQADETKNQ